MTGLQQTIDFQKTRKMPQNLQKMREKFMKDDQLYVYIFKIADCQISHLNSTYVWPGQIGVFSLFCNDFITFVNFS